FTGGGRGTFLSEPWVEALESNGSEVVEDHEDFDAPLPKHRTCDFEVLGCEPRSPLTARRQDVGDLAREMGGIRREHLKAVFQFLRIHSGPSVPLEPESRCKLLRLSFGIGPILPSRSGHQ